MMGLEKEKKGAECKIKLKSNLEYISSFISLFLYIYRSWMIFLDVKIIQKLIAFQRKRSFHLSIITCKEELMYILMYIM